MDSTKSVIRFHPNIKIPPTPFVMANTPVIICNYLILMGMKMAEIIKSSGLKCWQPGEGPALLKPVRLMKSMKTGLITTIL